ncbi:hypothetical protein TRV_00167 [Trichophyton verrucosum HKI 0517]|uniref:Uncharacterized protein n=1 Tax=Trichophyton verrucosum (strain HKI 0517) TaxID=663202 RepID=D4CZC5_TRIVH|nr:uncharacterized protein TRV_00167 [Trichophyton verrucosum HKI 0517]EFE45033.1 hypothetical protein TRV_00167 [Trichophyton verrucosum HKI 0517]
MITAEKKKGREYERLVSDEAEDIYPELIQSQRRWGARRVMEITVYTAVISVIALALGLFIGTSWPSSRHIGLDGYLGEEYTYLSVEYWPSGHADSYSSINYWQSPQAQFRGHGIATTHSRRFPPRSQRKHGTA